MKTNLINLEPSAALEAVRDFAVAQGEPAYRGGQVVRRLWHTPVATFEEMTELPKAFRAALDEAFVIPRLEIASRQQSADGTEKFLFRLHDGQHIETVVDSRRRSVDVLRVVAGWLCSALRFLCDRDDGLRAQPRDVRDCRTGS